MDIKEKKKKDCFFLTELAALWILASTLAIYNDKTKSNLTV